MDSSGTFHRSLRFLFVSALLFGFSPLLAGQTYIVDARGGPGSSFKDLPAAISSVPSGSVLRVKAGNYSSFTLAGKKLSIIGDGSSSVRVNPPVRIGPTRAGQNVFLSGFRINPPSFSGIAFKADRVGGTLLMEDILCPGQGSYTGAPKFQFFSCPNVHVLSSSFMSTYIKDCMVQVSNSRIEGCRSTHWRLPGSPGISLWGGRLVLVGTDVVGGPGASACCIMLGWHSASEGGPGILVAGGTCLLLGGKVTGGKGGDGCSRLGKVFWGKKGGPGVDVRLGKIRVEGTVLAGGKGGMLGGFPGLAYQVKPPGSFLFHPNSKPPVAWLSGKPARKGTVRVMVRGRPGSAGLLFVGRGWCHFPLDPFGLGSLFVVPFAWKTGPILSPGGTGGAVLNINAKYPLDRPVQAQFLVLEPSTFTLWATNSVLLMIRS